MVAELQLVPYRSPCPPGSSRGILRYPSARIQTLLLLLFWFRLRRGRMQPNAVSISCNARSPFFSNGCVSGLVPEKALVSCFFFFGLLGSLRGAGVRTYLGTWAGSLLIKGFYENTAVASCISAAAAGFFGNHLGGHSKPSPAHGRVM